MGNAFCIIYALIYILLLYVLICRLDVTECAGYAIPFIPSVSSLVLRPIIYGMPKISDHWHFI